MNERDLRDCFGLFATGVMIAATQFEGKKYGMTINSFSSLSLNPALLLFSIDNKSYNLAAFQKSQSFTLSILGEKQLILAQEFARPANEGKWRVENILPQQNHIIFENSIGYFNCEKQNIISAGDHQIIIGKIVNCAKLKQDKPLLYLNGAFSSL